MQLHKFHRFSLNHIYCGIKHRKWYTLIVFAYPIFAFKHLGIQISKELNQRSCCHHYTFIVMTFKRWEIMKKFWCHRQWTANTYLANSIQTEVREVIINDWQIDRNQYDRQLLLVAHSHTNSFQIYPLFSERVSLLVVRYVTRYEKTDYSINLQNSRCWYHANRNLV